MAEDQSSYNRDVYIGWCNDETQVKSTDQGAICDAVITSAEAVYGADVFFLLYAASLVFFMQAGFAMLCAGSVRAKNVKNIMLKNLLDACGGAIGFWSLGYAFAYGGSDKYHKAFIGNTDFFLRNFNEGEDYASWFFQFAFAATAATIVAGTVAERCKMAAYLCYSVMLTGFVYPVVVFSIWSSSGFLTAFNTDPFRGIGMIDFAGSGVVHMTGGTTALIAAIILGPRMGRFHDSDGVALDTPVTFKPHSVSLQILGTFILWFGWYGFNPGSALKIANSSSATVASLCAVTTTLAAASGCVTAMFTDTIIQRKLEGETQYDLTMAMNGALSGLVGITAGCAVVTPWASIIIGIIAGWVYIAFSKFLIKMKIDDAVDAIPVHFANGMWGCIAVGLFAEPDRMNLAYSTDKHVGWFYSWSRNSGDANLLLCQFCGVLWIIGWVSIIMIPFFSILQYLNMFRVDELEERVGLDISHHKGSAYDIHGPDPDDLSNYSARQNQKLKHNSAAKQGESVPAKEKDNAQKDDDEEAQEKFG